VFKCSLKYRYHHRSPDPALSLIDCLIISHHRPQQDLADLPVDQHHLDPASSLIDRLIIQMQRTVIIINRLIIYMQP